MRKLNSLVVLFLLALWMGNTTTLAAEVSTEQRLFGVGAIVTKAPTGEFLVKTEGRKESEGFVYTPSSLKTTNLTYRVQLKGTGSMIIKVEETDRRGQFLKSKEKVITLTTGWKTYELPVELDSPTSQLDVFVLTNSKRSTEFAVQKLEVR